MPLSPGRILHGVTHSHGGHFKAWCLPAVPLFLLPTPTRQFGTREQDLRPALRLGAVTGHTPTLAHKDEVCGHRCHGPCQQAAPVPCSLLGRSPIPGENLSHCEVKPLDSAHDRVTVEPMAASWLCWGSLSTGRLMGQAGTALMGAQ